MSQDEMDMWHLITDHAKKKIIKNSANMTLTQAETCNVSSLCQFVFLPVTDAERKSRSDNWTTKQNHHLNYI